MKVLSLILFFSLPLLIVTADQENIWATRSAFDGAETRENALATLPPLRCCYMFEKPVSFNSTFNYIDGVMSGYLQRHQAFLNWSCAPPLQRCGSDGTAFNEFISYLHSCSFSGNCKVDIGLGGFFEIPSRYGKVHFLPPFAYDKHRMYIRVEDASDSSGIDLFFIQGFDRHIWFCIIGTLVLFTFLKFFDRHFEYDHLSQDGLSFKDEGFRLLKAVQSTVTKMLILSDQSVVSSRKTTRQWCINTAIAANALIVILMYEASMTATLLQEEPSSRFQSLEDIKKCKISPSEVCFLSGISFEDLWISTFEAGNEGNGSCGDKKATRVKTYDELFDKILNGECKFGVALESAAEVAIRERYCGRLVAQGDEIFSSGLSMVLPLRSSYADVDVNRIMSEGTLELLMEKRKSHMDVYFDSLAACETSRTSLKFAKLRGFFIITVSVLGVGALVLLLGNVWRMRRRKATSAHGTGSLEGLEGMEGDAAQ